MSRPYVQTVPVSNLGESPHWNAAKQELYSVDIVGQFVHRYVPATEEHTRVRIEQDTANFVIPVEGEDNKYVVGVGRTLQMMEWDGRSTEPTSLTSLFSVEPNEPRNRFNDGNCDSSGRLWAGTMNEDERPVANFYKVTDSIETVQTGIGISNGHAWNKDNTLLYYIDTLELRVDVFDFDNQQGSISNRRPVYDFVKKGERGRPDGMNIDANGNLWVACFEGSQIINIDPTTGQKLSSIQMPAKNITSIAFGGPNLDVMFVTSAYILLSDAERLAQPSAGSMFQITNTGVKGMGPGNNFRRS